MRRAVQIAIGFQVLKRKALFNAEGERAYIGKALLYRFQAFDKRLSHLYPL